MVYFKIFQIPTITCFFYIKKNNLALFQLLPFPRALQLYHDIQTSIYCTGSV